MENQNGRENGKQNADDIIIGTFSGIDKTLESTEIFVGLFGMNQACIPSFLANQRYPSTLNLQP